MDETIQLLRGAILLEREELANDILAELNIDSIEYDVFDRLLERITQYDKKQYKQIHTFELQKVHDNVNFGRLQYEVHNPNQITIYDEIKGSNKIKKIQF